LATYGSCKKGAAATLFSLFSSGEIPIRRSDDGTFKVISADRDFVCSFPIHWFWIEGLLPGINPMGFEAGSNPARNEIGQVIRLYQVEGGNG